MSDDDQEILRIMTDAISQANLLEPQSNPGVTGDQQTISPEDSNRYARVAYRKLREAGYQIVPREPKARLA